MKIVFTFGRNVEHMIKTAAEYKEFLEGLRKDCMDVSESLPIGDRRKIMLKCATDLNISFMTVENYLKGLGTSPETSLNIINKINELTNG